MFVGFLFMTIECLRSVHSIVYRKIFRNPFPVESGTFGKVDHVDDIGTLHCIFDNGRTLGVIPGVDDFHVIREGSEQTEEEMNMSM